MEINLKNETYFGSNNRQALFDLQIPKNYNGTTILFVHGYMGFKDWGAWNLMQQFFTEKGFGFCKFNISHNGIGLFKTNDFTDLKAFSENTYSKEVKDITYIYEKMKSLIPPDSKIAILGHSRGGGVAILSTQSIKVDKIITLASISSIEKRFSDIKMLEEWKNSGVRFVENQRTKQSMPHLYHQVEDFYQNKENLSIEKIGKGLLIPILIIHGDNDSSVSIEEGYELSNWTKTELQIIQSADHVFGSKHPWNENNLPNKLEEVCELMLAFLLD
jgi:uncharacterized protein